MIELTVEMLKKKVASHEERLKRIDRDIEEKQHDRRVFEQEITSFKHCIRILENRVKQSE